jgi:L-amino acid N-acyltransferase YncA
LDGTLDGAMRCPCGLRRQSCGWREVGVHRRHGRLDGEWKDTMLVERLLGDAAR